MFKREINSSMRGINKVVVGVISLTLLFLIIEFFDEFSYGIDGAVLPAMRTEFHLSYAQVGLLLGLPGIINILSEPLIMLLGDTDLRKRLVLGGGFVIFASLILIATASSFPVLLLAFIIAFPASGAFVSLSQASLMDLSPGREPHMMARWTLAGSLGNLLGPLCVSAGFALALGWRWIFLVLAALALVLVLAALPRRFPAHPARAAASRPASLSMILGNLRQALRNPGLLRWILLLQLSDLLLDIFSSYAPLYMTDVIGLTPAQAGLLLSVLMAAGLVADLLLIPLLERIPGRAVVRISAAVTILVFSALLLAPWPAVKIFLMVVTRFGTLGWYSVLQGEAYACAPGRSGTVMAINSLAGLLGGGFTYLIGWTASRAGLPAAMWLLLLGPLSLAIFVPRPD